MVEQSFLKALFHGVISEDLIFPYPEMSAEERENTSLMVESVRRFFEQRVDSAKIDREHLISPELLDGLKEMGLFGLQVPTELGGLGLSTSSYARVVQEVGGLDASIAVTLGAHQSIGLKGILLYGTPEQKQKYLPKLATGEHVAAFALTEPSTGSDAAAIKTRAELSADGTHYVLNGSKVWITNGGFAEVFTVFARTSALEEGRKPKITAFIVERSMGIQSGSEEHKLGIRGTSTTEIFLEDVKVPVENVLGEPGRGFKVAMDVLNSGRLGLAAGCVGLSATLLRLAIGRAQERRAFGRNIGEFGLIKDKVAGMMAETFAMESIVYLTAGMIDSGVGDYSLESATCKIVASEALWRVVNETLQIAAGIGYMQDYPYERILRDARINLIFEGTNEILRCFVALSGMQGPGRELAEVVRAMREPIKGFGLLSDFAIRKARTVLGRERMTRAHPVLSREAVIFEEYVQELADTTQNTLRKHGREIAEMQFVQKRIAESVMELFGIAACISRTTRAIELRGEEGARREIDMTALYTQIAHRRLRQIASDSERNDDELRKSAASRAYTDGGYPFDVI